jgi:hypothetical protein
MKTLLLFAIAGVAVAAAGAFGTMGASAHPVAPKTVVVAMRDPGCHWFLVGKSYRTKRTVDGPVSLVNYDEAALRVVGPSGTKIDKLGQRLLLTRGTYRITMVGQAPDDNHLKLFVR